MTSTQDTRRTWTFDGEEGGRIHFTYDAANNTTERYSGPDCDGHSSVVSLSFLPLSDAPHREAGTWYRDHDGGRGAYVVYAADPSEAAWNAAREELGHLTMGHYLRHQPEHAG